MNLILMSVAVAAIVAIYAFTWQRRPLVAEDPATVGQQLSQADRQRLAMLVRSGQKIEAIKQFRALTNAGLAVSKAAVERLAQDPSGGS